MTQRLESGLRILRNGKHCYVGQLRLSHDKLEIHSDDGDMEIRTPDELRREIADGHAQLLVPDGSGMLQPVTAGWKENESKKAPERRKRITQTLQFVETRRSKGVLMKDILSELATYFRENNLGRPPSERTLRIWQEKGKGHESRVSPKWHLCGNRRQGPDEVLLAVIKSVVNLAMIDSDRFTISAAWALIEAKYDEQWREIYGKDSRPPPRSMQHLKNYLRAIPWSVLTKLRMDGRSGRSITRVAVHAHTSSVLWDCVEMDATVLDILICDESGKEVGRPVLYVAIDVATGYVVGLHLTIQKPSTLPFVECLRFMLFAKPDDFDKRYKIKNRIEVFGKPILLRVDNGAEFIGNTAEELVYHLFGDMARCTPYRPEEKPHVERFNGTLKKYILTLPGATTSSVNGTKRTPPNDEKLFDIDALRGLIYRFVYDKYSMLMNDLRSTIIKKAVAPLDILVGMKKTHTEPVPISRAEFERSLSFKRDKRRLGHDGISFEGWLYHSDDLAKMYGKFGPDQYEFLYSDLDATVIHVISKSGGEPVPAYEKTHEGSIVDRATAKELNRRAFSHSLAEYHRLEETAKTSRGRAKQARFTALLDAAENHTRQTMSNFTVYQAHETQEPCKAIICPSEETIAPKGRMMGDRK